MVDDKLKPHDPSTPREPVDLAKRFVETDDHRKIVLGTLRTDEEARLAAEIEKLLD